MPLFIIAHPNRACCLASRQYTCCGQAHLPTLVSFYLHIPVSQSCLRIQQPSGALSEKSVTLAFRHQHVFSPCTCFYSVALLQVFYESFFVFYSHLYCLIHNYMYTSMLTTSGGDLPRKEPPVNSGAFVWYQWCVHVVLVCLLCNQPWRPRGDRTGPGERKGIWVFFCIVSTPLPLALLCCFSQVAGHSSKCTSGSRCSKCKRLHVLQLYLNLPRAICSGLRANTWRHYNRTWIFCQFCMPNVFALPADICSLALAMLNRAQKVPSLVMFVPIHAESIIVPELLDCTGRAILLWKF